MEDGDHYIVLHEEPNLGNPAHKSDIALRSIQGKLLIVWEALCAVIHNYGSNAEVIRPPGLDRICSCGGGNVATTDPISIGILTTTYAWGDDRGRTISRQGSRRLYIYIDLKRKRVGIKVKLKRLTIFIDLECQFCLPQQFLFSDKCS